MASRLPLILLAVTILATISSARVIPAEPVMLDGYGNPIMFLREKRTPVRPAIPHRAMMFTGYYRPARRSDDGDQATGVFAQGNSVSGGSYFGGVPPNHLKNGPEPIDEPEISSAQAEAAPEPQDANREYEQDDHQIQNEQNPGYNAEQPSIFDSENNPAHGGHPGATDSKTNCEEHQPEAPIADPEPLPYNIDSPAPVAGGESPEAPAVEEGVQFPAAEAPEVPTVLSKPPPVKKGKKTPVFVDEDEDEDDDDEEEEPYVPFLPAKGNRRQGGYVPNLNNFFPMMFSFPGVARQAGSSGTPPGVVTAIANSYSTGKGGVASSVATAYGGSPNGKKARRAPPAVDQE